MIARAFINGKEVILYSVGQVAAKLQRHPDSIRRLQREGFIPDAYTRTEKGDYRMFTLHQVNILMYVFLRYNLRRGTPLTDDAKQCLHDLWSTLNKHYNDPANHDMPEEAKNAQTAF